MSLSGPPSFRRPSPVHGVSYDTVKPGKAPIPIEVAPKPSQARLELHPSMRPNSSPEPQPDTRLPRSLLRDDERRDSGLGTANSTKRESRATTVGTDKTDAESTESLKTRSIKKVPSAPRMETKSDDIVKMTAGSPPSKKGTPSLREAPSLKEKSSQDGAPQLPSSFLEGLSADLPSFSLEDLSESNIQFSKRGSLLVKGKRPSTSPSPSSPRAATPVLPTIPQIEAPAESSNPQPPRSRTPDPPKRNSLLGVPSTEASPSTVPRAMPRPRRSMPSAISRLSSLQTRSLTSDEELLSRRIRSMYEEGTDMADLLDTSTAAGSTQGNRNSITEETDPASPVKTISSQYSRSSIVNHPTLPSVMEREETELAGGMEDWQGVNSDQVDRYGFIVKPPELSVSAASPDASTGSLANASANAPEGHGLAHMATQLKVAAETPRRSRSLRSRIGARRSSVAGSARSLEPGSGRMSSGDRRSTYTRPTSSQASYRSTVSNSTSRLRRATNHLPQNRNRKYLDEAGDMLTLPPGLADVAESEALKGSANRKAIEARSAKERQREDKWRKMAKPLRDPAAITKGVSKTKGEKQETATQSGGGMQFTFDTTNTKLISRTWKGIPDRWRATAWWSFLETSAKKNQDSLSNQELIDIFYELLKQSSPDDMQIDLDVPRTIGGHVMFRKRYRGGQRLLFRILHSLSLYFPDPGYVQGMAALAATFLCYFQEELAFVMLVRMWELRGLAKLYQDGFDGLMTALSEFEQRWLEGGTVGGKLKELGITPTAYGTRWYLTVFNYSIPFSAQLRVWDVFLLLGDADTSVSNASPRIESTQPNDVSTQEKGKNDASTPVAFGGGLDVLHATSAALIDATREILLDSDFENAMKTLTSWVPVRDEDLLMRVAKIEYKMHKSHTHKR